MVDSGGLDVGTAGRIRGGKSTFADTAAGFWLGYDSNSPAGYKLKIGNNSESLVWDGSDLTITGTVNANGGTFSGNITATGTISGGTLSGATITGGTIQTANAGNRIVLTNTPTLTWYGPWAGSGTVEHGSISTDGVNLTPVNGNTVTAYESGYKFSGRNIPSDRWGLYGRYNAVYTDLNRTLELVSVWTTADAANVIIKSAIGSETARVQTHVTGSNSTVSLFADTVSTEATTHSFGDAEDVILTIDGANDSVGIGTTSPASGYKLDVNGAVYSRGSLRVGTNTLYVDATNNYVGILDTTPSYPLDVAGSVQINTTGGLYLTGNGGTDRLYNVNSSGIAIDATNNGGRADLVLYNNGLMYSQALTLGFTNSTSSDAIITTYETNQALYINPNGTGRVLFDGTDIEVAGIMLRNWVDAAGQGYACANVDGSADGFITYKTTASCGTSSIRYKTDVQPMSLVGVEAILDLTPVTYKLKEVPESGYIMGAIAEQAADLGLEWMVERNERGEPETLIYDRIGLYLIPVVKEQKKRIAELERRLQQLEKNK